MLASVYQRLDRAIDRFHERRLGIHTAEWHEQVNGEYRGYGPTSYRDFRIIARHLIPARHETFIDYGSGLGRVLILAGMMPWGRVIGIEFDSILADRARENIDRVKARFSCPDVSTINVDATEFTVPQDASTLFFTNPFVGSILAKVLENVRQSYLVCPRGLTLVCNLPSVCVFDTEIRQVPWLSMHREIRLTNNRKALFFRVARHPSRSMTNKAQNASQDWNEYS